MISDRTCISSPICRAAPSRCLPAAPSRAEAAAAVVAAPGMAPVSVGGATHAGARARASLHPHSSGQCEPGSCALLFALDLLHWISSRTPHAHISLARPPTHAAPLDTQTARATWVPCPATPPAGSTASSQETTAGTRPACLPTPSPSGATGAAGVVWLRSALSKPPAARVHGEIRSVDPPLLLLN
jgi:hypothetical protein